MISYGTNSATVTVVDHASDGFNFAFSAMNVLTDGHGDTGVINANAQERLTAHRHYQEHAWHLQ